MAPETVQLRWSFPQTDRWIGDVKFTSDASLLAISTSNKISIYKLDTGTEWSLPVQGHPCVLRFSPDDRILAAGMGNGTVYVLDIFVNTPKFVLTGHTTYVRALAFSPDGCILYSGSQDASVRSWSVQDGTLKSITPIPLDGVGWLGSNLRAIAISPSNQCFASSWFGQTNQLRINDLSSGRIIQRVSVAESFETLNFSPDGRLCIGGGFNGHVTHVKLPHTAEEGCEVVIDRGHVVPSGSYHDPCKIDHITTSSDNLWVVSASKGKIHFTHPMTTNPHFAFSAGAHVWKFDFHATKNLFAAAVMISNHDSAVQVWHLDPSVRNTVSPPPMPPRDTRFVDWDEDDDDFDDPYPWKD